MSGTGTSASPIVWPISWSMTFRMASAKDGRLWSNQPPRMLFKSMVVTALETTPPPRVAIHVGLGRRVFRRAVRLPHAGHAANLYDVVGGVAGVRRLEGDVGSVLRLVRRRPFGEGLLDLRADARRDSAQVVIDLRAAAPLGRHHAVVNRRAAGIRPRHGEGQRGRRHEARHEHLETSPEGVCRRPMACDTCGSWVVHLPPPGASLPEAIAITFWKTACAFLLPLDSAGTSDSLVAGTRSSPTISKAPYSSVTR